MKAERRGAVTAKDLRHPVLRGVEPAHVRSLVDAGETCVYATGELLLREGEEELFCFFLIAGSVKVFYTSPDGFEVVVKVFGAPSVFGEMECLTGIPYLESVVAVEKAKALRVPAAALSRALEESHPLSANLLRDLAARLCIAAQNENALAFLPVSSRLANLLLTYVRLYGVPVDGGTMIRVKLSQDELANGLGVAKKSVSRTFREWQAEGLVTKQNGCFVVRDVTELAARGTGHLDIGHRYGERPTPVGT